MPLINYIGNRQEALSNNAGGFVRGGAPAPPALSVEYLIVGGGGTAWDTGTGGSAGGFLSSSASIAWDTSISVLVGLGGTNINPSTGESSSLSGSSFGYQFAGGADNDNSGQPQFNDAGVNGPGGTHGGGAGAGQDGQDGLTVNGNGGDGLLWLNGIYYAGGGGGVGDPALPTVPGLAGLGGGGYISGSGVDGLGGGAGGSGVKGGNGIVIIRYSTGSVNPPYDNAIQGGTLEISGGYAYRTFTGSGELIYRY